MKDEFGALSKSNELEDTLKEPDFIKKAIGLFSLRETIQVAYKRTSTEITDIHAAEGLARAKKPGRLAFFIGLAAGAALGITLFGPASIIGYCFATAVPGLFGGCIFRGATRGWQKIGSDIERDEKLKEMGAKRSEMVTRVESELEGMEKGLINQSPTVRDQFRAAFQHAALKTAIRENGLGSKRALDIIENLAPEPSAPDPASEPAPDVTTDSDVTVMKKLKVRKPGTLAA